MNVIVDNSGDLHRCRADVDFFERFGDTLFQGRNGPVIIPRLPNGLYVKESLDELRRLHYIPEDAETIFDQVDLCRSAFAWDHNEEVAFLSSLTQEGAHILDAGCGWGRLIKPLADRGFLVDGYDASFNSIAFCKNRGLTRGTLHVAELGGICSPNSYALIFAAMNSARYCRDAAQFIRFLSQSAQSLVTGGCIALQLTVCQSPPSPYCRSWEFTHDEKTFQISFELYDYDLHRQICHDLVRLRQVGVEGEYAELQRQLLITRETLRDFLYKHPHLEFEGAFQQGNRMSEVYLPQGNYWFVLRKRG
jgi:SAM-dependent methyltransferase